MIDLIVVVVVAGLTVVVVAGLTVVVVAVCAAAGLLISAGAIGPEIATNAVAAAPMCPARKRRAGRRGRPTRLPDGSRREAS